jgi:hypothetical protein
MDSQKHRGKATITMSIPAAPGRRSIAGRARSLWNTLDPSWRWALQLFVGYRVLLSVWSAWVSSAYPRFAEEAAIAIWPIDAPIGYWLQRLLLWPIARYDVIWYVGIAEHCYAYHIGSTAFHPLYPLFIGVLGRILGGNYLLAGWLIAQVCCVAMLAVLYRLVLLDYDEGVARRTTLFLLGSPLGFSFLLPYSESLLLLCIVGAFYAARLGRWWLAGLAGAAAALTKQPGVVVLLPLLWELWRQQQENLSARRFRSIVQPLVGLALTPLGLLVFLVYRATLGDIGFSWGDPHSLIAALLVSPSYKDVWGHYFTWPWMSLLFVSEQLRTAPSFYLLLSTFLALIMAVIVCYGALRQRISYSIYSLALLVMNLSIVFPLVPFISVVRRFTIIFPLFIQLALWGRSRAAMALILISNTFLWVLISEMYVRNAFIP